MKREAFGSRLGFILVSAGCAIGIGNVWKFPYICGAYGGAAFILIYLVFLAILGIPVMVCEFAVGRGSKLSVAGAFDKLQKPGTEWSKMKYIGIFGCYLLMMFYTSVTGWLMYYCFKNIRGDFVGASGEAVGAAFSQMQSQPLTMVLCAVVVCVIGFSICFFGLKNGIEKITKVMMIALLFIMIALAVHSVTMPGATEGVKFYLVPDIQKIKDAGLGNAVFAALSQAFFTLSIGIGAMLIFGSYLDRSRSLTGEAINITVLDTFVALIAGFIVIPACFAYSIQPDAGPNLIFITLPNIFSQMSGGRIWGSLFFLFLSFAALTTIIAVFENLVAINIDAFGWSRKKSVLVSGAITTVLSIPCALGFNVLSGVDILGSGSTIMDFEDFIVSNNLLPLGSLGYVLFCTRKSGWGWDNFLAEANTGKGMKFPKFLKNYLAYVVPAVIIVIYLKGYYDMFKDKGTTALICWMSVAALMLLFVILCATVKIKKKSEKS